MPFNYSRGRDKFDNRPEQRAVLDYALAYAALGWPVLSVVLGSKAPAVAHGVKDATTEPDVIRRWFGSGDHNIGIACGERSGFFVLDIDPRNGGDDALDALEAQHGALPETLTQRTGGGGRHLLFKWDARVRRGKIADGIDVKKNGGYIVAEPSRTTSEYAFLDWEPFDAAPPPIAGAPDWLLALLDDRKVASGAAPAKVNGHLAPREAARIRDMLAHCPGFDEHDTWIRTGMALHHATSGSDEGYALWAEWARQSPKFDEAEHAKRWPTFGREAGECVTLASIKFAARRSGWRDDAGAAAQAQEVMLTDFYAYLPAHRYLYIPTRELWPPESVDSAVTWPAANKRPSRWLDQNRAVTQITWAPGQEQTIENKVVADGGMVDKPGACVFNLYRAPAVIRGVATAAGRWRDHWRAIYNETDADHAEQWLAFKLRHPGLKVNHALVLGGEQGIGKDSLLEPLKVAVGPWNWSEVSPAVMLGRFNGWTKSVILRISEARDLGEIDRFAFYDHCKTYIAAPPDVLLCDEKNLRAYHVMNVMGVIITTNHETDGLFLPPDDRRHFVMWSEKRAQDFDSDHWNVLWAWYQHENGFGHVAEYLRCLDLSEFDPKRPPTKTAAWYEIVNANRSAEESELADLIERLRNPDALTLQDLIDATNPTADADLRNFLTDRKNRRSVPHRLAKAGYAAVRNTDAKDGLWKIGLRRQAIYARRLLTEAARQAAARGRCCQRCQ